MGLVNDGEQCRDVIHCQTKVISIQTGGGKAVIGQGSYSKLITQKAWEDDGQNQS